MARPVSFASINQRLEKIDEKIADLSKSKHLGPGWRLKSIAPGGTAGKPSKARPRPRLLSPSGSRTLQPEDVPEYREQIERGRELVRLRKERALLIARLR
jgi:hypothetical protein